jgi:hypothetical protein
MKGYKTLIVNGAVTVLPIIDYVANNGAIISAITGGQATVIMSILGLVNIVLRWVTTTPVLKAEPESESAI